MRKFGSEHDYVRSLCQKKDWVVSIDDQGTAPTGEHKYVLHFDAGKLPPVATFWNLAMYGSDMLFVENDFGRYSLGSTTDGLKKNPDGPPNILIQHDGYNRATIFATLSKKRSATGPEHLCLS